MKKGKILLLALFGLMAAAGIAFFAFGSIYQATGESAVSYYSQIDNGSVEEITPHGGMNYQYTLHAYTESGEGKDITLDTSRILRDKAYIRIDVAPLRGVINWAEMQYEELPAAVQSKYGNP